MGIQWALKSHNRSHICTRLYEYLYQPQVLSMVPAQHVEHTVASNSKERCPHSLDVSRIDTAISNQEFCFSDNFIGPFFLIEVCSERVGDGVGGYLMTISIKILDLGIISPFVGHIESCFDRAAIWIEPSTKEVFIESFIEIIDSIIKCQHDKLGDLVSRVSSGNVLSTTVAILK